MCFLSKLVLLGEEYREMYVIDKGKNFNLEINSKTNIHIKANASNVEVILKGLEINFNLEKLFELLNISIEKTDSEWIFKENNNLYECKVLICSIDNLKGDVIIHKVLQIDTLIDIRNKYN